MKGYKRITPTLTVRGLRFYIEQEIVEYKGIASMVVTGLKPGVIANDISGVYDICLVPMMSSDDLGAGAGCGICVQSDDADLSSDSIDWYPESEQSRIIPDHLSSPALIGLTIAAIANEVEKAQKARSTIFLIQVPDKDGRPDNAMASRLAEIAQLR